MFPNSQAYIGTLYVELRYFRDRYVYDGKEDSIDELLIEKKACSKHAKKILKPSAVNIAYQMIVMAKLRVIHIYKTGGLDGIRKELRKIEVEFIDLQNQSQNIGDAM